MILIYQSGIIEVASADNNDEKSRRAAIAKLGTAINAITSKVDNDLPGSHQPLHKVVQALKPYLTDNSEAMQGVLEYQSYQCDHDDNFVLEKIAAAYKINHTPEPTVESIEAELIAAQGTQEAA